MAGAAVVKAVKKRAETLWTRIPTVRDEYNRRQHLLWPPPATVLNHCRAGGKDSTGPDRCCVEDDSICRSALWESPVSESVYTLIRWHVPGIFQGSCNLAERVAEGRFGASVCLREGGQTCICVLLYMTDGSKQEATPNKHTKLHYRGQEHSAEACQVSPE